ncbi:MAG: insulinase family protein, partial [Nitrospira sp.]
MTYREQERLNLGCRRFSGASGRSIIGACVFIIFGLPSIFNPAYAATPSLAERVIEHRLGNGLTVLMVERHQTPVVSINITFAVGGMDEQVGQTGLAHLYEHMAFKG